MAIKKEGNSMYGKNENAINAPHPQGSKKRKTDKGTKYNIKTSEYIRMANLAQFFNLNKKITDRRYMNPDIKIKICVIL